MGRFARDFLSLPQARTLTRQNPWFDAPTRVAVSLPTIQAALTPKTFTDDPPAVGFGSLKAPYHSKMVGHDLLEAQPHNQVHNNTGGFMGDFLSPVDPIFFAHHGNIDRLWEVWTRKQLRLGLPTLPTCPDLAAWKREPFLFFVDAAGQPVTEDRAGDYATIGSFDYAYQPGSGGAEASRFSASRVEAQTFEAKMNSTPLTFSRSTVGEVTEPKSLIKVAQDQLLVAQVALHPPADTKGVRFHVLVNPPEGKASVGFDHPSFAGSFEFFGSSITAGTNPLSSRFPCQNPSSASRLQVC